MSASSVNIVIFGAINFPVHQLVRYQLDGPWERHKAILTLAPNLVEAHITVDPNNQPWLHSNDVVEASNLRRIYVSDPRILDYVRSPALEGLALLVCTDDESSDNLRSISSFLDRSACPLQALCLRGFPDPWITIQVLKKFPSITRLVLLIKGPCAGEALEALRSGLTVSEHAMATVVAPQLRSIFFGWGLEDDISIDYQMYLKMLRSRWGAENSALEKVALLTEGSGPDSATLLDLHALRNEGLDLLVLQGPPALKEMVAWRYASSWMF
ncbi:F-box domain-containing protein [Mycena venus]|uniref:F-box domain-containing protein n=1 Tax=Mycena venus TaxID=2733690 RepID=A0A8H6XRP8_9AGAR|nr:F-box domain-containing protein [Mycena venus]